VWPKQVKGLTEGMGVGVGQMVFGTVSLFFSGLEVEVCEGADYLSV
jgi:hypothetical protein